MGGERETKLSGKSKSKDDVVLGNIRLHENAGEVHFHDDKLKLKAAVPVAEWWKAWEKLRTTPGQWEWIDSENDTHLVVETYVNDKLLEFEAAVSISSSKVGSNFKELNKFTKRK